MPPPLVLLQPVTVQPLTPLLLLMHMPPATFDVADPVWLQPVTVQPVMMA
jgi:hypothetical protein